MATRPWIVIVILVVVGAVAIGGSVGALYLHNRVTPPSAPKVAALGGNATVNYIGLFGSGPEQGRVFDTSIYPVAVNNASFPKALEFGLRGGPSNYTPLGVYLGASTPSGGYTSGGVNFVSVVTGFWQGIIGMEKNATRTVVLPPAIAYGPTNPSCLATLPLSSTLPILQTVTGPGFQASFPGVTAAAGKEFTDPHYGWDDQILSANASYVTLMRMPYVGEISSPGGWPVLVTSVQSTTNGSGTITIQNELSPSQAGHILGHDFLGTGPCSANAHGRFIITDVNLTAGTFTEDYNPEVQGQTLIFVITLVAYYPSATAPSTGGTY